MINQTIIQRQSVGKVAKYYSDGADDYYAKEGDAMAWHGKGAKELGLEGKEVTQEDLRRILDGQIDKKTRMRRYTTDQTKERMAYDLTFSAPKSVSVQALVGGDKAILQAHDDAIKAVLEEVERLTAARQTENGKTSVEMTNNMVAATFRHELSREQEPQLHTHLVIMNMTQREDGKWRSLMNDFIFEQAGHLGTVYDAALARGLEKQGYQLRYDEKGNFNLAHFTPDQVKAFSSRKDQIDEALEAKGLDRETATAKERNEASLSTRKRKKEIVDRQALHESWKDKAREVGIDFSKREWAGPAAEKGKSFAKPEFVTKPREYYADEAVKFAVASLSERQTNNPERTILSAAMKHGIGKVTAKEAREALERQVKRGDVIKGEPILRATNLKGDNGKAISMTPTMWVNYMMEQGKSRKDAHALVEKGIQSGRLVIAARNYTTKKALDREKTILNIEARGRKTLKPIVSKREVDRHLKTGTHSAEQKQAIHNVLGSKDRFIGVHGFAGVGKSHLTKPVKDLAEEKGMTVRALAPYGGQVKALQSEGLKAQTVASFLKARDKKIDGNTLVIVDESGVIPARQMQRLMEEIEKHGARAVFLGDTQQTKAIEAGKPYDQLISAGMSVSYVTEIQRQKANPELLKAVQFAAEGDTSKSLDSFDQMKAVREIAEPSDRHKQIAEDFAKLDAGERRDTIIVTGTNASRKEINTLVRRELGLEGQGTHFDLLNRLDTTQAERRFSRYYAVGAVVVPEQDFRQFGLERGKQYQVLDTGPGNLLTVKGEDGATHSFDPSKAQLSVYGIERSELATGDSVKITRNDKGADLANGDRFTVLFHDKETNTLTLEANDGSGRQITLSAHDRMFVALDYASTVHSAQGKTCQKALLNLDSKSKTTVKEVYYVGVSRAKLQTTIYTDNLGNLPSAIQRDTYKTAALELTPEKKENKSWLDKLRTLVSKNHNSEKNKEGSDKTKTNEMEKGKEKEKDGMSR